VYTLYRSAFEIFSSVVQCVVRSLVGGQGLSKPIRHTLVHKVNPDSSFEQVALVFCDAGNISKKSAVL